MVEKDLENLSISEVAPKIRSGEVSPVALTKLYIERIERLNPLLSAYLTPTPESALEEAAAAEKEIRSGGYRGPLHGIPVSIKDNFATRGVRTTAGAKALSDWKPDFDATVVSSAAGGRRRQPGQDQHARVGQGKPRGEPVLRHSLATLGTATGYPGGSSSGSAVAVAAGMCMASVGTDAAGSVRNPSSLCGIVGLKPTYGRVSVFGGVPGTGGYSTNHFGPLTRTVADCATMMQVIAGHDPQDPLSSREPVPDYAEVLGSPIEGMRVGIIKGYFERFASNEVSQALANALDTLRSLGMAVEEVTVPHMDMIPAVQLCTSRVESTADAEYYLRNHARDYSPSMLSTQIQALTVSGFAYNQSQRIRRLICEGFDEALDRVDVIVAPTSPVPALTIDESMSSFVTVDGRKTALQGRDGNFLTLCTMPFNVNGLPSLSINCGFSEGGLPIGMQIAARRLSRGYRAQGGPCVRAGRAVGGKSAAVALVGLSFDFAPLRLS